MVECDAVRFFSKQMTRVDIDHKAKIIQYLEKKCKYLAETNNSGRGPNGHGFEFETYNTALNNIKAYGLPLSSGSDCQKNITGIGKVIAGKIDDMIDQSRRNEN